MVGLRRGTPAAESVHQNDQLDREQERRIWAPGGCSCLLSGGWGGVASEVSGGGCVGSRFRGLGIEGVEEGALVGVLKPLCGLCSV